MLYYIKPLLAVWSEGFCGVGGSRCARAQVHRRLPPPCYAERKTYKSLKGYSIFRSGRCCRAASGSGVVRSALARIPT